MQTPRGLKTAGKRLYQAVSADYELDPPEAELLAEACKTVDMLADLRAEVARSGLMCESSQGIRVNPAQIEARQLTLALAKLLAALKLPTGLVK